MANAKLNIDVGYNLDKNSYSQLIDSLDKAIGKANQLAKGEKNGTLKTQFQEAAKAAERLQGIVERSWDFKLNQVNLTKFNTELQKTGQTATDFYNKIARAGKDGAIGANTFARNILNANVQLKQTNQLLDRMATTFKNTIRYGISSSVYNTFANSVQKAYEYTKNLDTSLNDIRIVSGKSAEEMAKFAVSANRAAQSLGKTTLDYTKAATIFYQQGLDSDEVAKRTEVTLKAANVTGQNAQEVSEQLTAVWNGYQITGEKLEETVDKLAAVAAHSASNLEELSTGMSKVASAAHVMGVDIDQLNAQMSTIISVTRQAPESVGTALRTIYARIADVKAGLDEDTSLGNYSSKMAKLGFNVLDANGNLKDMGNVIEEIGGKWQDLTREQQISLAQTMAGTRQYNNLLTLFDNWDKYTDALETSRNAAGTLQKQQDIYMESTEAHLKQLQAEAEELYNILFDQDAARGFIDLMREGLDILGNYVKGLGGGMGTLIGLGSQLANIFSKQIAGGINHMMENIAISRQQNTDAALKEEMSKIHAVEGDVVSKAALEEELVYANKIKEVRGVISQDQLNDLTNHQKEIGLLEEKIIKNKELHKIKKDSLDKNTKGGDLANLAEIKTQYKDFNAENLTNVELQLDVQKEILQQVEKRYAIASSLKDIDEEGLKELRQELDTSRGFVETLERRKNQLVEINNIDDTTKNLEEQQNAHKEIINQETERLAKQQALQNVVRGTTALLMSITAVISIGNILTDKDLSTWDKFKSVIGILVMQLPSLITSFNSLKKMKESLLILTGKTVAAQAAETTATVAGNTAETASTVIKNANVAATKAKIVTTGAETVATNAQTAAENAGNAARLVRNMLDHAWLSMGIVAAIGAVALGLGALINNLLNTKTQEEKLKEAIEESNEKLQEAKDKYKELTTTISNYQSARDGIDNLTEGTLEFYDAILKANEEAQDLIDKWGLIAGTNYTIDENGLININEDTLKRGQFYEQQSVYRASAQSNKAQADLQDYYVKEVIQNFSDELAEQRGIFERQFDLQFGRANTVSYEQAEFMLDTWGLGVEKNTETTSSELGVISGKVLTSDTYEKTESDSTKEITNAIKTYLPQYNSAKAQSNALKRQQSEALIRGYGSYEDVEVYNQMSSTQKQLIQDAMTENREKFLQNDFSDIAAGMYLSPYSGDAQEYIQKYLKEAYGYIWDETTKTWTNNLGNIVTQSTIDKIIEDAGGYDDFIEEAITAIINSGGLTASSDLRRAVIYSNQAKDFVSLQGTGNEKSSAQRYVAEAFSSLKLGQQYDFGLLTDEEITILNKLLEEDYNKLQPWQQIMQPLQQISLTGNTERSEERQVQDLAAYNEELREQAKELETTTSALKMYAAAMKNAGKLTGEQNQEMAQAIADSYKFNKSYNEAVKIYEKNTDAIDEWTEAWENHEQVSYETADAMGALYDELTNIFGKDFNPDIMLNNMGLVKQMLTGTEEEAKAAYVALESLNIQDLFANNFNEDVINNIFTTDDALQQFADHVAGLDFGQNISESYFNQLRDIVNASEMTKEQVEDLFASMHLTPPKLTVVDNAVNIPEEKVEHTYDGQAFAGADMFGNPRLVPVKYKWTETSTPLTKHIATIGEGADFSQVKSTIGSGNFGRGSSNSRSNAGKSGSGGSNAKPSQKDPNKDELDRYQLVNVQLKEISKELTKLDKEKNKLLGGKLLANLNNQIKLLNDQITVTEAKLKIAKQEQSEVADKLAGFGVQFDSEGNIANYAQIFRQEQAKLNAVYSAFNSMSKDSQDAYQDTVKAAEETWKTFKDSISKYDNLIGETIPQLYQDVRDAFDKQTEMFIQEFNMEIKLRLDMSSAVRDWNEFRRKVIDGIKDDDILGTAKAKLADFESYYNAAGKAEIQALTKQLQGQLEELRKQDATGSAEWYRDNRAKAIEDLKDNYDKIRNSLTEIIKLEEEMQQKVLDMMNQAQDKFDEQIGTFENINKHLEHNIQLINLLTDENDYAELSKQYAAQTKNREQELDFYTKQRDYWENYLKTLEEGSKEWDEAKAKYNEAAEAWASALETTIEAARKEFENNINLIFQTINNQLTDNKGLEYLNEQWELLSDNSNMVLDNINKMQKFQDLTKKYNDAINSTSNIAAQKKLAQLRDQELAALKGIDNLNERDLERAEKKLDIIKAQIALENAQRNKTQMRLRRDSQGNYRYQFVADEEEVQRAQQDLANAYNELYNFDKERYKSNLNDAYAAWNDYQEKMAEAALINDPEIRGEREALLTKEYNERILILTEENERIKQELNESTIAELNSLYAQNADNYELMTEEQKAALNDFNAANQTAFDLVFDLYTENTEKFRNMTQDQLDIIENQMVPQWTSGYQTLIDKIEGEGGIEDVSADLAEQLHNEAESYKQDLGDIEVAAGQTFGEISDSQNDIIQNTKDMLDANDGLISKYTEMTDAVMDQYSALKDLMGEYEQAAKDAKQAAEDAYNYIMREKEDEAKAAAENVDNGPTTGGTGNYNSTPEPAPVTSAPVAVENTVPSTPFTAVIPQGTNLYDIGGNKYKYGTRADRTVTVQDTSGELWRVWGSTFNPNVVYVNRHALGYDTGGYTGDWGNDGRLAFLHQKELVLNKEDTTNMLNAVEILRGITANIGADILGKLASASAISMNGAIGNNTLDQNVHIEATFPGVTSSIEIQDALNNLVNMASQKVLQR